MLEPTNCMLGLLSASDGCVNTVEVGHATPRVLVNAANIACCKSAVFQREPTSQGGIEACHAVAYVRAMKLRHSIRKAS